jgi:hypothetical protein
VNKFSTADAILIGGSLGSTVIIASAYFKPGTLQNFQFADFSVSGLVLKFALFLYMAGLPAFFYQLTKTYNIATTNILRALYITGFIATSYCSGIDWQCFQQENL